MSLRPQVALGCARQQLGLSSYTKQVLAVSSLLGSHVVELRLLQQSRRKEPRLLYAMHDGQQWQLVTQETFVEHLSGLAGLVLLLPPTFQPAQSNHANEN